MPKVSYQFECKEHNVNKMFDTERELNRYKDFHHKEHSMCFHYHRLNKKKVKGESNNRASTTLLKEKKLYDHIAWKPLLIS
jgi:hypothetical protein